ncbi:M10 family metallopeptidase C-terminal domain-containing protein [Parasedimentitalea denitrificans]|nr:M10 family metallopeptidase C-terminal domain-containing protein [Sedimentitalea sp. CY04]
MAYRSDRRPVAADWNTLQYIVQGDTAVRQSRKDIWFEEYWSPNWDAFTSQTDGQLGLGFKSNWEGLSGQAISSSFEPYWFDDTFTDNQITKSPTEDTAQNQSAGTSGGLAGSLGIGGFTNGEISASGELDEYTLNVEAGKTYTINLFGNSSGNRNSLTDSYLRVYTDAGLTNLLIENDNSIYNYPPNDYLNSYVKFTVATDATLYVQASAVGTLTGEYSLIVEDKTVERPRDSLDWGSSFYDTSISVYFAGVGEIYSDKASLGFTQQQIDDTMHALQSMVSGINLTASRSLSAGTANMFLVTYDENDGYSGYFRPPGRIDANVGLWNLNSTSSYLADSYYTNDWDPGNGAYHTLIHEFGHALGLAHAHSGGGTSNIMDGVDANKGDYGDYGLNQGAYTIMGYNYRGDIDGGDPSTGTSGAGNYGFALGPSALDLGILQSRYGADMTVATGNNAYILDTTNDAGTGFKTIWDAGGTDYIQVFGATGATIDLRAATLLYEEGGGGWISHVDGIYGGFTIANGVVIENAYGASGNDSITGNDSGNIINGEGGNDTINGMGGSDILGGRSGTDRILGGAGNDYIQIDPSDPTVGDYYDGGADYDTVQLFGLSSSSTFDFETSAFFDNEALSFAGPGRAYFLAAQFSPLLDVSAAAHAGETVRVNLRMSTQTLLNLSGMGFAGFDQPGDGTTIIGDSDTEIMIGSPVDDIILGSGGNDTMEGGSGVDQMIGGSGNDSFRYSDGQDGAVGEIANGGQGANKVLISGGGTSDLRDVTFTNIGEIEFDSNGPAAHSMVIVSTDQLLGNAGFLDALLVDGNLGDDSDDTLRIDALSVPDVDMTGFTFQTWNNDTYNDQDLIVVFGNGAANRFYGSSQHDVMNGFGGNDLLEGNDGNDTLDGGTGADTMTGGLGNDVFRVDNIGDTVTETSGQGVLDVIETSINYTLGTAQEIEILRTISPTGFSGLILQGNSGNQRIEGNAGPNILSGGGGLDTLAGGIGNDLYRVDDLTTVIEEFDGEGNSDTIETSLSYTLTAGLSIEELRTNDASATTSIDLTGNELFQLIYGNAGDNRLDDGGGANLDLLTGYAGNDTYLVNAVGTSIYENSGEGTDDQVHTTVDFALASDNDIEVLKAADRVATTALALTGNALSQEIIGNDGANTLDDGGGAGADNMTGHAGDDLYVVGNAGTTVTEAESEGNDTVNSAVSYALGAFVENLSLLGADDLDGTGNELANTLIGNSGANYLEGSGANDTLTGLAGNDTLDGGTGADGMSGGTDDDLYIVDDEGDTVIEGKDEGIDTAESSISRTLSTNVENLTLTGSNNTDATGNALGNILVGNDGDNVLAGKDGEDTHSGGEGSDTFVVSRELFTGPMGDQFSDFQFGIDRLDLSEFSLLDIAQLTTDVVTNGLNFIWNLSGSKYNLGFLTFADSSLASSGPVTVTGTATQGEILTATIGPLVNPDGISTLTYQWLRGGVLISGANAKTYTLQQDDVAEEISARVVFLDGLFEDVNLTSAATKPVQNVNDAPTGAVTISGEMTPGETLTADGTGITDLDGIDVGTIAYQWLRDGAAISGATKATYILTPEDIGKSLSVTFSYTDTQGTAESISSVATTAITPMNLTLIGTPDADVLHGEEGDDTISGLDGPDRLIGNGGNDSLLGGDGNDTLNGGAGDDFIFGGETEADLRDIVYAGSGNDSIDAGYGNDLVYGQEGNDTIAGGFGTDDLQGQDGNDVITGSALSDLVFGGNGDDFVNGGFGHDRINGGSGADKFYHLGIYDHGSDWVQDYMAAEGDLLLFGEGSASGDDFQVNFAHTASAEGVRSGDADVAEGFVIYRPTEQIIWALVDGAGQDEINLKVGGDVFDLLA